MKIAKYLLKTNRKTIMSDWESYKRLGIICRTLKLKCDVAYDKIIVPVQYFFEDSFAAEGCVKRKLWLDLSQEQNGNYRFFPMDYKCKSFSDLQPCKCVDCKYNSANRRYISAATRYNNARSYQKNFWSEKFANVK